MKITRYTIAPSVLGDGCVGTRSPEAKPTTSTSSPPLNICIAIAIIPEGRGRRCSASCPRPHGRLGPCEQDHTCGMSAQIKPSMFRSKIPARPRTMPINSCRAGHCFHIPAKSTIQSGVVASAAMLDPTHCSAYTTPPPARSRKATIVNEKSHCDTIGDGTPLERK